ncbi:hypothetical protein C3L33_08204, partial [Rhododendron williamsianum]
MLHPVTPGLDFWYYLGITSSPSWVFSFLAMDFIKKTTGVISIILISTLLLSWLASNFVLSWFYFSLRNQQTNRFLRGYEDTGKAIGFALLLFGNVGLYYFSEKSVACMLTFLFLAFYGLCTLFCIQPCTDFGALDFLISASLNQALSLFRLRSSYFWLGTSAFIVIAGIRFYLEPKHSPGEATSLEVHVEAGQSHHMTNEDDPPPPGARLDDNPSPSGSSPKIALSESANPLLEGDSIGHRDVPPGRDSKKRKTY